MPEISKTADLALQVLEHVATHGPQGTSEIARALQLHRTVVHRLLNTLQQRGYVRRAEAGYLPGATVLRLANAVEPDLVSTVRPYLEQLAAEHGETFILTIPSDDEAIQADQVVGGGHFMRVELARGFRHPLSRGASGRSILAFLPDERVKRIVARSDDPAALRRQLATVRRDGYAVSRDELTAGVQGVSVPVLVDGVAVASIGAVFPAVRGAEPQAYSKVLVRAADKIARAMRR